MDDALALTTRELPLVYGLLLIWGILDCFLGYRIFKATVTIVLAVLFAAAGTVLADSAGFSSGFGQAAGAVLGLVLGLVLAFALFKLAVAVGGAAFAVLLASPYAESIDPPAVLLIGAGIIGALVAVYLMEIAIKGLTALSGAGRVFLALAYFTTGRSYLEILLQAQDGRAPAEMPPLWVQAGTLVLAAVGFFAQLRDKSGKGGSPRKTRAKEKA